MAQLTDKLYMNPLLVLREEFDDWAILFDPDTGDASALNPVSVFICKHLDGAHSIQEIIDDLKIKCQDVPESMQQDIVEFIKQLEEKGYAGYYVA